MHSTELQKNLHGNHLFCIATKHATLTVRNYIMLISNKILRHKKLVITSRYSYNIIIELSPKLSPT